MPAASLDVPDPATGHLLGWTGRRADVGSSLNGQICDLVVTQSIGPWLAVSVHEPSAEDGFLLCWFHQITRNFPYQPLPPYRLWESYSP